MKQPIKVLIFCILFSSTNFSYLIDELTLNNIVAPTEYVNVLFAPVWAADSDKETTAEEYQVPTSRLPQDYSIGKGDELEVAVWRNELLSRKVVVRPDGKISLPLIQDLQAEGYTVPQLREQIARKLSEYVDNPKVSVIVSAIKSYRVSVLGRVVRPGVYPITGDTTFVEAIALAGGFTEWADEGNITLVRRHGGKEQRTRVNYRKFASGKDLGQDTVLKPGDTIIVP